MLDDFTTKELLWAINGANFGLWSWDIDADEIRWSSQIGEIYGVKPLDFPDDINSLSKLLPELNGENLQENIILSADPENGQFEFEHSISRPNGLSGWVRNYGRVEFDDNRRPTRLTAISIDITDQKEVEFALQTREEQFRRFSELTSDYLYEVDMTAEPLVPYLVAGSYERIVGYTATELAGKGGWPSIMHKVDLDAGLEVWNQLRSGVPTVHEYRITNKDGETRWLRDHSYPIIDDGKLIKLVGGVKDISETNALQDQLVHAKKHEAMAHLAAAVAHDFNNLLFVVSASTELMSGDRFDIEDLKSDIHLACDRASELTRSLLAFTRNDLPQSQTIQLSETLKKTRGMLQRAVGEQISISMELSAGLNDKVDIDLGQLQLVLLNLATNARAAMANRGELIMSISAVESDTIDLPQMDLARTVVLSVTDTGTGIKESDLPLVFDAFFTTKPAGEGLGVGLAACLHVVENAGGTIRAETWLAQGTTFSIYLPTVDTPVDEMSPQAGKFAVGGKEHILVVEDDATVQRASLRTLRSYGYDVTGVNSIQAAQQAVASGNYDLMIVDVHLSDGDGVSFIDAVKETNHDLSALLVSGYIDADTREKIRAGGYSVLPKPFSAVVLARSVRATLDANNATLLSST